MKNIIQKIRCAVYTRKSTDEGLEQDFNSLDAQREACLAYITSQKAEGWIPLADRYDDPAFSGAISTGPPCNAYWPMSTPEKSIALSATNWIGSPAPCWISRNWWKFLIAKTSPS